MIWLQGANTIQYEKLIVSAQFVWMKLTGTCILALWWAMLSWLVVLCLHARHKCWAIPYNACRHKINMPWHLPEIIYYHNYFKLELYTVSSKVPFETMMLIPGIDCVIPYSKNFDKNWQIKYVCLKVWWTKLIN